jgi:hypothetical protein
MGENDVENLPEENSPHVNIQESRNRVKRVPFSTARSLTSLLPRRVGGLILTGSFGLLLTVLRFSQNL